MQKQALTTPHQKTNAQPLSNFIAEHDVRGHGIPFVSAGVSSTGLFPLQTSLSLSAYLQEMGSRVRNKDGLDPAQTRLSNS